MKINYKKLNQNSRKKKFKTLYDQIPFLEGMEYRERTWWIRYYKLKHTWKTHFNNLHFYPDDYFIGKIKPWEKPTYKSGYLGQNHQLNADLVDIECLFSRLCYDWVHVKLEEIDFPDIIDCDFSDIEGCQDCRNKFECELRT